MDGVCCDACGWEWTERPEDPGPCGAHVDGRPCQHPEAFAEMRRHRNCDHEGGRTGFVVCFAVLQAKVDELEASNEQLGAALVVALQRHEMLKTINEMLILKLGFDYDALAARAVRRMEAREAVSAKMESERKGEKTDA